MSSTLDPFPVQPTTDAKPKPVPASPAAQPQQELAPVRASSVDREAAERDHEIGQVEVAEVGQPGGATLYHPPPVALLPLSIQRGFRIKMLTILLLQLLLTMATAFVGRLLSDAGDASSPATGLGVLFPAGSMQTLILGLFCIGALPGISTIRDKHPWNQVCTALWSICWGIFIAVASLPGGLVRSHVMFVVFGSTTLGIAMLLICSACLTFRDPGTGEKRLWSFQSAGCMAYVVMLAGTFAFFSQTGHLYESVGHFISAVLFASVLFAWVAYDSGKLCERMQPDEYMKGVVYFYTDFLLVCCCCICAGLFSSAAS